MSARRETTAVLLLLAAGAALRFTALDRHSLWTDEFFTLRSIGALASPGAPEEATPPLYFFLLKQWTAMAGTTPAPLRAFSALWGVAGLVLVWAAARRRISAPAGLFALTLTVFSPLHLAYSQEARAYAMVFALSAASLWSIAELADDKRPLASRCIAYLASTIALLYTHYWGLFIWAGGMLYVLLRSPASALRTVVVCLPAVAFLPFAAALAATAAAHATPAFWTPPPSLKNLWDAIVAFTGARFFVGGWLYSLGYVTPLVVAGFATLWTAGLLAEDDRSTRRWLLSALVSALLLPFLLSYSMPQLFLAGRYTLAVYPAALWLAARGWNLFPPLFRAGSAAALTVALVAATAYYFTGYQKGNVKDAAELVATIPAQQNTVLNTVLILPEYLRPQWNYYYRGTLPSIREAGMDELEPKLASYKRAVFVTLDVPNPVKDALDVRYRRIDERRYPAEFHLGLVVAVYRLD